MEKGKQIKTLDDLVWAKADKKSVTCPKSPMFNGIHSASMMLEYRGSTIARLIKLGLFICKD